MPAALLLLMFLAAGDPPSPVRIVAGDDARTIVVQAILPERIAAELPKGNVTAERGESLLKLAVIDADGQTGPAMFGEYHRENLQLRFTPRYPLVAGKAYRAVLRFSATESYEAEYRVPERKPTRPAVVERIYPTADVLPANHLKFYLHFSQPMREGAAIFDRLHLLDSSGNDVPDPWRRTELWTPDARRFTLWIHPGRVKQGVNLREDFGPVLQENAEYTLVIDAEVQDEAGQPLGKPVTKKFRTTASDRDRPLPQHWKLTAPAAQTNHPLRVEFGESLDAPLAVRMLRVINVQGHAVPGRKEVGQDETSWTFVPKASWPAGQYVLEVDPLLEDLAGNTPLRVFDTDLNRTDETQPRLRLPFAVE